MTDYKHQDKLDQDLHPGDTVVYIRYGMLNLGYVGHLTPKRVQIFGYNGHFKDTPSPQIPSRVIKIEPHAAITKWFLSQK